MARWRILQQELSIVYILSGTSAEWVGWGVGAVQFNMYHTPPLELITCSWWQCLAAAEESSPSRWPHNPLLNFINHRKTLSECKDRNSLETIWRAAFKFWALVYFMPSQLCIKLAFLDSLELCAQRCPQLSEANREWYNSLWEHLSVLFGACLLYYD